MTKISIYYIHSWNDLFFSYEKGGVYPMASTKSLDTIKCIGITCCPLNEPHHNLKLEMNNRKVVLGWGGGDPDPHTPLHLYPPLSLNTYIITRVGILIVVACGAWQDSRQMFMLLIWLTRVQVDGHTLHLRRTQRNIMCITC